MWFYSEAMLFSVYGIRQDEILTIRFLFLCRAQQISRFVFKTVIAAKDYLILSFPEWKNHFFLNLIATFPDRHGNSLKVGGAVVHYNKEMWDRLFTVTPHLSALANEEIPQELFREIVRRRRQEGKLTSIYSMIHDYPGIFSMSDPGEAAWTIWYIESCGADGFLKWAYDAWCKDPLEENVHCYFEAGDMFLVYPGERREKEPDVRVSPRFRMLEEAIHDVRKLCQMKKVPEYEKKAEQLLDSVRCFYGKGKSNGVGTAGFMEADEQIKRELAEEVERLHRAVGTLSCRYAVDEEQLMERTRLPEEGRDVVRSLKMTEQEYHRWKELFYKKEEKFFEMLAGEQEKEGLILSLYVRFATDLYKAYVEKEIPDEVYDATFSDFTIWYRHCVKERKKIGLCEEQWLKLHLKMKLFRLGRLQFEPDEEQKVIHVHVPEGESLSREGCEASFAWADRFFDSSYKLYDCESWLLSPALKELLEKESGILQFQNCFEIQSVNLENRQAEERVFGSILEDPEAYPENTSLQKALKNYLSEGKKTGAGYGCRIRKKIF